jgi:hypothetical protein
MQFLFLCFFYFLQIKHPFLRVFCVCFHNPMFYTCKDYHIPTFWRLSRGWRMPLRCWTDDRCNNTMMSSNLLLPWTIFLLIALNFFRPFKGKFPLPLLWLTDQLPGLEPPWRHTPFPLSRGLWIMSSTLDQDNDEFMSVSITNSLPLFTCGVKENESSARANYFTAAIPWSRDICGITLLPPHTTGGAICFLN